MRITFSGPGERLLPDNLGRVKPGDTVNVPDGVALSLLSSKYWAAEEKPEWPLKTPPEEYLKKSPDGPRAELARAIIAEEE